MLDVTVMVASCPIQSLEKLFRVIHLLFPQIKPYLVHCHLLSPVFVGDEAFPLKPHMMCPYPGKNFTRPQSIYNYCLSRAHRVIENSFGILASRWRIFHWPIIADPEHVVTYTKAAVALHNFLRTTESSVYCPLGFLDSEDSCGNLINGSWREEGSTHALVPLRQLGSNHPSTTA